MTQDQQQTSTNWKNVGNWHWVEKNCMQWARDHLAATVPNTSTTTSAGTTVSIDSITKVDGDCDLNQRKGKIMGIFDVSIVMAWSGTNKDGLKANGTVTVPELMHDTKPDELVFDVVLTAPTSSDGEAIKEVVRKELTKKLRTVLSSFNKDLIEQNTKDVYISPEEMKGHPTLQTYQPKAPVPMATESKPANAPVAAGGILGGVCSIEQKLEFVCSAADLFDVLLNPTKVSAWTRAPAQISPAVGPFSLFGGNISGEITHIDLNKGFKCTWRQKQWPAGHHSEVQINLNQLEGSTELKLTQTGVPIGDKQATEANWRGYYWNSIKRTFGYGSLI